MLILCTPIWTGNTDAGIDQGFVTSRPQQLLRKILNIGVAAIQPRHSSPQVLQPVPCKRSITKKEKEAKIYPRKGFITPSMPFAERWFIDMKLPLISVIVPVYNADKYLKKCLDSIINQTYRNLEIILIDDGSTDNSGKICNEYTKKDGRIIVAHLDNCGVSSARNYGLEIAKGEYIGFVDSDDYISEKMFEILFNVIQNDGSDMACCNYIQINEDGIPFEGQPLPIQDGCIGMKEAVECFISWGGYYVVPVNKLYKAEIFHALTFPVGKRYEDLYIIYEIIKQCKKISHINKALYYYVRNAESFTMQKFNVQEFDFAEAMINIYRCARKNHDSLLKDYCVRRLSYKMEEYWKYISECINYRKRYNEIKKQSLFLVYEKKAWGDYNVKGRIWNRIRFLFS